MPRGNETLDLAVDLTRFYTLVWQCLRPAAEGISAPMSLQQFTDQIHEIWTAMVSRLEKNPIVMEKMEKEMKEALHLAADHEKPGLKDGRDETLREKALLRLNEARIKASAFSDLVAVLRRL